MKLILILILIPITLSANTKDDWIRYYTRNCSTVNTNQVCKDRLESAIERMNNYKPMVEFHLRSYGLPEWLSIIPIIESDYNRYAVSYINGIPFALGAWQVSWVNIQQYFKITSLTQFSKVEIIRSNVWKNPEFNTEIAVWILKGLFDRYKNRKHAIYAYNAGSEKVNLWLAGKSELPEQTVNFYNQFLALYEITKDQEKYGINAKDETEYYTYVIKNKFNEVSGWFE